MYQIFSGENLKQQNTGVNQFYTTTLNPTIWITPKVEKKKNKNKNKTKQVSASVEQNFRAYTENENTCIHFCYI